MEIHLNPEPEPAEEGVETVAVLANHHRHRNATNDVDEEAADADAAERASANGSRHDHDRPNSTSTFVHMARLWTWCKNKHIPSFILIVGTLSLTVGLAYTNWQKQKQIAALQNELTLQSALLAALPSASESKEEQKRKGKAPKCVSTSEPSTSSIPSSYPISTPSFNPSFLPSEAPSDNICTPLPFVEEIVIDEDGRVVDITGITDDAGTTTGSQCTASSYTAVVETLITSTFSTIGQWDPNNSAGKGITINNDAVSDATSAALVVGGSNSKRVVVRDQTFDVNALAGLSSDAFSASLDPSSSTTFCRSTFVAKTNFCVNSKGSLNIVDSILEGGGNNFGLRLSGSNTVIVGKNTKILARGGTAIAFLTDGGSVDIHEGIFGDGTETYSLAVQGGTADIYGGEWKSSLWSIGGDGENTINLYRNVNGLLCDGNAAPAVTGVAGGESPNYLDCPPDYQVPTFPECE